MSVVSASAPSHQVASHRRQRSVGVVVAVACLGLCVSYIPVTMISVALSSIARTTGADSADLQWSVSLLVIPMASLILTFGLLGDLFGRRRIFLVGLALCAVGAAISMGAESAGSQAIHILWIGQAITGCGAAALIPATLSIISHAETDPHKRSRLIGIWATSMVGALAIGGYIAAGILANAEWRWIYLPVIPLAIVTMILGRTFIEESHAKEGRALDFPGQILAIISIVAIVDGVISGGSHGFSALQSVLPLVIGLVLLAAFVIVELRSKAPMMSLRLFAKPEFALSAASAAVAMFAYIGLVFMLSIFFGPTQHLTPIMSADRLVVMFAACAAGSQMTGPLLKKVGYRPLLVIGMLILAAGFFAMGSVSYEAGLGSVAWRIAIAGFGMGMVLPTVTAAAVNSVPHTQAGMASAAINAIRQFGGALGPAVFGVLLVSFSGHYVESALARHGVSGSLAEKVSQVAAANGVQKTNALAPMQYRGTDVPNALADAETSALHIASMVGGTIFIVLAVACLAVFAWERASSHRTAPAAATT